MSMKEELPYKKILRYTNQAPIIDQVRYSQIKLHVI
jgi:hypothetical protein